MKLKMAMKIIEGKVRSSSEKLTKIYHLRLLCVILLVGFVFTEDLAIEELDEQSRSFQPDDEIITTEPVFVDFDDMSGTSSEHDIDRTINADESLLLDETEQVLRTSPPHEDSAIETSSNALTGLGEDYNAVPDSEDIVPLDWTTLDKGLKDLDNLINLIDEGNSQSNQNDSETVSSSDGNEDEPSKPKYPCSARIQLLADINTVNLTNVNDTGVSDTNVNSTNTANSTDEAEHMQWIAQTKIVNASELLELVTSKVVEPAKDNNATNTTKEGHCVFVMFFAPWCKFSAASAPHFNAIGRAFEDIDVVAVDAFQFRSLNARYGTVSVPNFLFFYNSKPVLRYNYSERNYDMFTQFIHNHTGLIANSSVNVTDIDYEGPVPSLVSEEPDYALWFSGFFLLCWFAWVMKVQYGTLLAAWVEGATNYIRHIWRTGEFYEQVGMHEHEHID